MRTLRRLPSLLFCLALGAGGCRDYGEYLSPQVLAECDAGTRTEGCLPPGGPAPGATVVFVEPALTPGTPDTTVVGRIVAVALTVNSVTSMDRVDLTCRGLQLASWRPGPGQRSEATLSGTLDLLPCRAASDVVAGSAAGHRRVQLELTVTDPLGARVVSDGWSVLVDFLDGTLPGGNDGGIPEFALLDFEPKAWIARRPLTLEVTSDRPLSAPPQVLVQGRTLTGESVPSADGILRWRVSIPEGLEPELAQRREGRLEELAGPVPVEVAVIGRIEGGASSQFSARVLLDRRLASLVDAGLDLEPLDWDLGRVDPVSPVAIPGGLVVATVAPSGAAGIRILGLEADSGDDGVDPTDAGTSGQGESGAEARALSAVEVPLPAAAQVIAFNGEGAALLLVESKLQFQTGPGSQELRPVAGFPGAEPGTVSEPVRVGARQICNEEVVMAQACGLDSSHFLRCTSPEGTVVQELVQGSGTKGAAPRGPGLMAVGLSGGFVTYGYPGYPECAFTLPAVQALTSGGTGRAHDDLPLPLVVGTGLSHFGLAAGASMAVVGHSILGETEMHLTPVDVMTGLVGPAYFAEGSLPPSSSAPSAEEVLLVRDDGFLLALTGAGFAGWAPGKGVPALNQLIDTRLQIPVRIASNFRLTGVPHVRHSGNRVTLALEGDQGRVFVLELDGDLSVRWAWGSEPGLADQEDCAVYGLPDGPHVDLVCWGPVGAGSAQIHRIAR